MKKLFGLIAVLTLGMFLTFGVISQAFVNQENFWAEAAQTNMAEIQEGQLALQKSQNEQVKQLAQKLIDDHTQANDKLKEIAASKNVTLPTDVSAKQKAMMEKLSGLSGDKFDKEFIKEQISGHEKAISMFKKQADKGADADAKAYASSNLPALQSHLEMARSINNSMKGGSNGMTNSNRNSNSNRGGNSNSEMNSNMNMNHNMNSNMNMNSNRNHNMNRGNNRNSNSNGNMNNNMNSNANMR